MYTVSIVFGKEQVIKVLNGEELTADESRISVRNYSFDSEIEKAAFLKGVNEAVGWTEYCILENEIITA